MRKPYSTKIDGVKFTAEPLGVVEGMKLEGRVSAILAKALSVGGLEIANLFGGGDSDVLDKDLELGSGLFKLVGEFRSQIDWDAFTELLIDSCEQCYIAGDTPSRVDVEDLDRSKMQHYKLFFWFLECQLGPFIDLAKPFLSAGVQTKVAPLPSGE